MRPKPVPSLRWVEPRRTHCSKRFADGTSYVSVSVRRQKICRAGRAYQNGNRRNPHPGKCDAFEFGGWVHRCLLSYTHRTCGQGSIHTTRHFSTMKLSWCLLVAFYFASLPVNCFTIPLIVQTKSNPKFSLELASVADMTEVSLTFKIVTLRICANANVRFR
jgi:hypothetical protein